MLFLRVLLSLTALLAVSTAHADNAPLSLHKGINLSSWLANAPRQPMFERDFIQIKQVGFDHIRLPVNPEMMGFKLEANGVAGVDFSKLDAAIAMANKQALPVILDMHPGGHFMDTLQNDAQAQQSFIDLWVAIATHYKSIPANMLAFELLNEPQYYKQQDDYDALVAKLVAAIRQQDAQHMIVIAAARGSSIEGLQALKPVNDSNVAYDFHFYEPYMVTHQGIHKGFEKKMLSYFHDVPYPSDKVDLDAVSYAQGAPKPAQAQNELEEYTHDKWDAQRIAARINIAKQWADSHHVRLICGEFGVLRNHIDPESRYRWIADTRTALEADGIAWELWDYTDLFGIAALVGDTSTDKVDGSVRLADPAKGSRVIEPAAITALGLHS
jgi:endoglucanase